MYIDTAKCVKCKKCVPYCPVGAIREVDGHMAIDLDVCVECGSCQRYAKCPRGAIYNVRLEPPRAYRKAFSDPFGKHENTTLKHMGRGTEEVKTNDVTGIVHDLDTIGFAVELGRPGVSASFADIENVAMAVAPFAEEFEVNNPVTALMVEKKTGKFDDSVLGERVLSAIFECPCRLDAAEEVLEALKQVSKEIDTVFSLCLISRVDEKDDTVHARSVIDSLNIDVNRTAAKTNLGLGRPRYEDRIKEASK